MNRYIYILTVNDNETGEEIGHIEASTEETLLEKLGQIDENIRIWEEKQRDYALDQMVSLEEEN